MGHKWSIRICKHKDLFKKFTNLLQARLAKNERLMKLVDLRGRGNLFKHLNFRHKISFKNMFSEFEF